MRKVDMSSKAIDARLRQVEQLRRLCLSLGRAGERARATGQASRNPEQAGRDQGADTPNR